MFALFLTPDYAPFAIAFVVMVGIGLIEGVGLGLGHLDLNGPDLNGNHGVDVDSGLLDWLGLGGEIPILIWLTSLLGCFTLAGVAIQQIATVALGAPLHWGLASGGAFVAGSLLNTLAANGLARIMPGFETSAITSDDLLGRRGTILEGTARRGQPARAKVLDRYGQAHFVMLEPHGDDEAIAQGETGLLVRRDGALFFALPDVGTALRPI